MRCTHTVEIFRLGTVIVVYAMDMTVELMPDQCELGLCDWKI